MLHQTRTCLTADLPMVLSSMTLLASMCASPVDSIQSKRCTAEAFDSSLS
jgi:hypothetical protein